MSRYVNLMLIFSSPLPLQLPAGWERGYCPNSKKYFYFNSDTGASTWNIQEVTVHCQEVSHCHSTAVSSPFITVTIYSRGY